MAVTHSPFPDLPAVAGFRLASTACGLKQSGAADLLLVEMAAESCAAGLFTRNQVVAAPVTLCRHRLQQSKQTARALLVNAGNANAVNGEQGMQDALALSRQVSERLQVADEQVLLASTGVIGVPLPVQKPLQAIPQLVAALQPAGWDRAAQAIMTTDTFAKGAGRTIVLGGATVQLVGICKGAGMIHPDMATMLAFLFTDAAVDPALLQSMLQQAVEKSFNSISVDGDTSTNDTVLLFASGRSGAPVVTDLAGPEGQLLSHALIELCQELAQAIVRDGEGASKFIAITVEEARNGEEAKQIAMAVAKSPLVKTACAGSDPNWGRILAAVGYAGVPLAADRLSLWLGDVPVVEKGGRRGSYTKEQGEAVMQQEEIAIRIALGLGEASHTVWSCDLTHGYITINAEYHT
ncbi:MAG: bifunctional glutamate N-acetyltransferase/amino-acid acetyltransferase ArgJ [Magnetococcales bacterium]|nr:bifunctional glutamate N-acetyltransferase/amino-acid acetyltransferase ArgJ [Magnetococcales bacterium]